MRIYRDNAVIIVNDMCVTRNEFVIHQTKVYEIGGLPISSFVIYFNYILELFFLRNVFFDADSKAEISFLQNSGVSPMLSGSAVSVFLERIASDN